MRKRTNTEWLSELRGDCDLEQQQEAHQDLGLYVYEVTYNYLQHGRDKNNRYFSGPLAKGKLKVWAEKIAQETLKKVSRDDFALLNEFELLYQSEKKKKEGKKEKEKEGKKEKEKKKKQKLPSFRYWIASIIVFEELRGDRGDERQSIALQSLIAYLYKSAVNFLIYNKAQSYPYLSTLQSEELKQLAQDYAQKTCEKLVRNDFASLKEFSAKGRFTSWLTTSVQNTVRNELRKRYWAKRVSSPLTGQGQGEDEEGNQIEWNLESEQMSHENKAILQQIGRDFQKCLQQLPESRKTAILLRLVGERTAREAAQLMNKSEQAVHLLVSRTKPIIRKCLQKKGWDVDILHIFDE